MPNMGTGMMPLPGGEGYPDMTNLAGQMGSGQCVLMQELNLLRLSRDC